MNKLTFKNKWQKFWWEVFSEDGKPSSKRIVGGIMILCTQVCLVIEFALHGANSMVKDLFEVNLIIGASLLGISNITSIWKGGKISVGESANQEKINVTPELIEEVKTEKTVDAEGE